MKYQKVKTKKNQMNGGNMDNIVHLDEEES